jgi:hypothetical protein
MSWVRISLRCRYARLFRTFIHVPTLQRCSIKLNSHFFVWMYLTEINVKSVVVKLCIMNTFEYLEKQKLHVTPV